MLRALVLILVLANAGYRAWSQGWLDGVGASSQGDREPQRLQNQVRPEIVRILPPSAAASGAARVPANGAADEAGGSASAPVQSSGLGTEAASGSLLATSTSTSSPTGGASAVSACLEAGPFNALQLVTAQSSLRAAAVDPVADITTEQPGVWMVYMGRYVTRDAMARKIEELKRRQLDYEEVQGLPGFEPGLSLGRFGSRQAADEALAQVSHRNVRTARVVSVAPPATLHWLRQTDATPARQKALLALKARALGEGFAACGSSPAAQAPRQLSPASTSGAPAASVAANSP